MEGCLVCVFRSVVDTKLPAWLLIWGWVAEVDLSSIESLVIVSTPVVDGWGERSAFPYDTRCPRC